MITTDLADPTINTKVQRQLNGSVEVISSGGKFHVDAGALTTTSRGIGLAPDALLPVTCHAGTIHRDIITFTNYVLPTADHTTSGASGNAPIFKFPRGQIKVFGAVANLTLLGDGVGLAATAAIVMALGTVAAAADATLASTEANIIASTACTLSSSAGTFKGKGSTALDVDNTTTTNSTQMQAILNAAVVDAGTSGAGILTLNGTIEITWINLGDN